jgi:TnpA family transposase
VLRRLDQESQQAVPQDAPRAFIPKKWKPYVGVDETINRRYYELCTLWELRNALRSGDVWLDNSRRYATLNSYLIPSDQWAVVKCDVCQQLSLPENGAERVEEREKEVTYLFSQAEHGIASDEKLRVENQRIIVSPSEAEERPESAIVLEQRISERLPKIDLADLLIEVDSWVSFSECFTHAAGDKSTRDARMLQPLYACLVAQAENFGLEQMAHISNISYTRLSWCNHWYLRDETIKAAFTKAVNYHHHLPLSQYWGNGMLSSSDGQRFPVAGKFRYTAPLPKYFGYGRGVTFYTWSSDQLSQYGTKFITSTLRDATYVLDEILDNETDLEILEHTTDTAGYTDVIFALFDLLGLQFSPRIRDLHEQQLWRPASLDMKEFPSFQKRVKGIVHRDFILEHWDDVLRLVGSLKRGWVTASLFIQKLQAYPRKHLLLKVLQEYGKLVKTRFILKWYADEAYRRRVRIQLNKGEALHGLRTYIHMANKGYIRKREPDALTNQVNCLNLVTNAVIIWNTVYMQAAIEQMTQAGEPIQDDDIQHIWPTRYEHINVHGRYHFNVDENLSRKGLRPLR